MIFNRFDRLFEEASSSPECCDKLLKRLQRSRKLCVISFLVLALIALALCLSAFIPLIGWLRSPTFPMPPSVDWIVSSIPPSLIYTVSVPFFIGIALNFAFMLHNDVCIKMLLFMRGHQIRPTTTDDNTRNA